MFEVGDKVVIVDLDKYEDLLRTVGVSDEMEELEGKEARIICKLDKYRVYLDITDYIWVWYIKWLRKVDSVENLLTKKELLRIKKVNNV